MIEFIRQWIINIVALVLFIVIIEIMLPSGKMKKYVNLATGTIIIIAIIYPIINFFGKGVDIEKMQIITSNTIDKMQIHNDSRLLEEEQLDQIIEVYRIKIIQQMVQSVEQIDKVEQAEADVIFNEDYSSQTFGEIRRAYIYISVAGGEDENDKSIEEDSKGITSIAKVQRVVIGKDDIKEDHKADIDPEIKKQIINKITETFGVKSENVIISQLEV
jgi:stage III sporulation protein AF